MFKLFLWLFVCLGVGGILMSLIAPQGVESAGNGLKFFLFMVGNLTFQGASLVLIHWFLRKHDTGWMEAFGWWSHERYSALCWGGLTVAFVLPTAMLLGRLSGDLLQSMNLSAEPQSAVKTLQAAQSWIQRIYFGAMAIVVAPVVEEFLFRGVLYPSIKQLGFPRLAFWGTSILFGAFHGSPVTMLPLTFLALVLTSLYERTGVLLAPTLTHSLFNAANFIWLLAMDT